MLACKKVSTPSPTTPNVEPPPPPPPPLVTITPSFSAARLDFKTIQFSNLTTTVPDSCKWYFGDGDSAVVKGNATVQHAYKTGGTYVVQLKALDTYKRVQGSTAGNFDVITSAKILGVWVQDLPLLAPRGGAATTWDLGIVADRYADILMSLEIENSMGAKQTYRSDISSNHDAGDLIKDASTFTPAGSIIFNLDDKLTLKLYDDDKASDADKRQNGGKDEELMTNTEQFNFTPTLPIDTKINSFSLTSEPTGTSRYIVVNNQAGGTTTYFYLQWLK